MDAANPPKPRGPYKKKSDQLIYPTIVSAILALVFEWRARVYRERNDERAFGKSRAVATLNVLIFCICLFLIFELHFPLGTHSCMPSYASRMC